MAEGNSIGKIAPEQLVVHELVIRWMPQTGQIQFGCSVNDQIVQLGMLEMAKMALVEQKVQAMLGHGPSVIVPGRFAS
jgi:hypothetical protein